jgi:hypothetical protein
MNKGTKIRLEELYLLLSTAYWKNDADLIHYIECRKKELIKDV